MQTSFIFEEQSRRVPKRHPDSDIIWSQVRNPQCRECKLCESAQSVCLLGDGPVPSDAMIVGEGPGYREDEVEVPFSGKSGIFLRKMLKEVGLDPRKIFITNVTACRPPGNRTPTAKEAKLCASLYLDKQLKLVNPKVILLLGNVAVAWAKGKKTPVTKIEGTIFRHKTTTFLPEGIMCVPSRHPSSVIRVDENDPAYPFVVQKFKENLLLFKRTLHPVKDNFKFETTFPKLEPGPVYVDIESDGLDPFRSEAKLWCLGIYQHGVTQNPHVIRIDGDNMTPELRANITTMLERNPIMCHRAMHEGIWFKQHFGITPRIYHDTKVGSHVMNENEPSGLKFQCVSKLGVEPWSTEELDFTNPDFNKLLPYNGRDSLYGNRLYRKVQLPFLKKRKQTARLLRYIVLPAEEVFIEVVWAGFHIDMKDAQKKIKKCREEKKRLNDRLNEIAEKEVNPGSPKQMNWLFYTKVGLKCPVFTDKGNASTSEASLIRLKGHHEVVDLLSDWRGWDKNESTYLVPWTTKGPILHANYGFTSTDTGRLNSSMVKNKRNQKKLGGVIHQCPRDKFIRNLICPRGYSPFAPSPPKPKDWCTVAADLSQAELRFVADAAQEPTMIEIFNSPDADIHMDTAKDVLGAEEDAIDEETRKKAKAVNFGFIYGMWAKKFQAYALEKFNIKLTIKEAHEYRRKYFRKYKWLLKWHTRVEAKVRALGWIESLLGRRRNLPAAKPENGADEWVQKEAVRQAINSPIQSIASDINLFIAALLLSESLPWEYKLDKTKCFMVGSAHDSLLFECLKTYAKTAKMMIKKTVAALPQLLKKYFDVELSVPILMDVDIYLDCWKGKKMENV